MRIGTRRSALAMAQAELVARLIGGDCELVGISTSGDRDSSAGDKGRWVGELERALLAGEVDLAVHSAKDLPGEESPGLALLGAPARAAAHDVLCGASALSALPAGARIGTSSIRRMAQLRAAREDLEVVELRGNVDTRLRRLSQAERGLDAIVLAQAGLDRLSLRAASSATLLMTAFVPAPGQGALALQGRAEDEDVAAAASAITDASTFACLLAERALAAGLDATCNTPLGANATAQPSGELLLRAWVGLPDGSAWLLDEMHGSRESPGELGATLAERMRSAGAAELLSQAEQQALR
jgi:hydroxymethylbilane synthase